MRIIAGSFGGRRLVTPRGLHTRPTADRVKEALFNILGEPEPRPGAPFRVLDLFAGSGALALEALSRGADEAVLVDQDADAVACAKKNIDALGVTTRARVMRDDVGRALRALPGAFDWIFLDPPYGGGALDRSLRLLGSSHQAAAHSLVIAEHDAKDAPDERYGRLVLDDRRTWGQTAVSFYRLREGEAQTSEAP